MYLQYVWWKYATLLFVFYFSHLFFVLFFIFLCLILDWEFFIYNFVG